MIKNLLLAAAVMSLALAGGCAKGGNGTLPPTIMVADGGVQPAYPNQSLTFTATVNNGQPISVTWSLSGSACTGSGNPCGTINANTGVYQAPATVPSPAQATISATSTSDPGNIGNFTLDLADITALVAPATLSVGTGLTQQFTAVAIPDDAAQTFTWTCKANGVACAHFSQDPNVSGLAYYTADDNCSNSCVQISAASTLDPAGCTNSPKNCTIGKASLVASRVNGTYAFQFSGYDSSNHATAVVGTFTASNGTVTSGVEYELTSGSRAKHTITGGAYTPTTSDPKNSNNAGTLTLTTGATPDKFQVVLDASGDIEMIEADGQGTGSGLAQISPSPSLFKGDQTYAFGLAGVDSSGNRVGYAGLLPMNGSGMILNGQMDVNDNGNATSLCGAGPCSITNATYTPLSVNGAWQMTLTAGSDAAPMVFDFFIASGSSSKASSLTFFVVTDPSDTINPAVSGTMVLQDSTQTYNNADFSSTSVSALTGVNAGNGNANVALIYGDADGSGAVTGQFDQNNGGTIVPLAVFPGSSQSTNPYTYSASSATNGRYIFQMLGNPTGSSPVSPIPFVLYATGQNAGFLLDQSSSSVMTGTMNAQGPGPLAISELQGTYAGATTMSGASGVTPIAANLVLTYPTPVSGVGINNLAGTQYPGEQTLAGVLSYANSNINSSGAAVATLTAPSGETQEVIYPFATSACNKQSTTCAIQGFFMMDETPANKNASIVFAKQ
ncbi:MAG: hypothetical protein WAK29_07975 [Terriglobales bacterium]